jgi:predicted ArsR family transcriptional regulator
MAQNKHKRNINISIISYKCPNHKLMTQFVLLCYMQSQFEILRVAMARWRADFDM